MRHFIFLVLALAFYAPVFSQTAQTEDDFTTISTPLTIEFEKDLEEETYTPKSKKKKKNFYYGHKTKKGFTTIGRGDKENLILFNYLKEYQQPNPYVRDVYWYDFERRQVRKSRRIDPAKGAILHGPYTVRRGDIVLEEGIFYIGTKHGRWVRKNPDGILIDKEKYYKGWPKESLVRYYDPSTRTKIKEIIPVEYGQREGIYYYFFKDGMVAVSGEYRYGEKVGKWVSFHENRRGRRKREVQFRKDPDNDKFIPYIIREWNSAGKVVYDRAKDKKAPQ